MPVPPPHTTDVAELATRASSPVRLSRAYAHPLPRLLFLSSPVWGQCTHVFHMHCLLKWIDTESSKGQCPMDRREWGQSAILRSSSRPRITLDQADPPCAFAFFQSTLNELLRRRRQCKQRRRFAADLATTGRHPSWHPKHPRRARTYTISPGRPLRSPAIFLIPRYGSHHPRINIEPGARLARLLPRPPRPRPRIQP